MATLEVLFTFMVLYCTTTLLVLARSNTYVRELPSGRELVCDRCPPGSRLQAHCTEKQRTKCTPCNTGYYTKYWNYIYDCLPCNVCSRDEVVVQECTSSSNRVCGCKAGFYRDSYFCRPHKVCEKGYGVKEMGTPDRDTVCEPCSDGFYSTGRNTPCIPHTECKSEENLIFNGTRCFDNVCVTCDNVTHDGWVKLIKKPLIEVYQNHKLRHFIRRLEHSRDIHEIQKYNNDCILKLKEWLTKVTRLHNDDMKHLANELELRVKNIQDTVDLCRNSF